MIRKMTCIICPNGCDLEAQVADRKCESVSGNLCPKGAVCGTGSGRTEADYCKLSHSEERRSSSYKRSIKPCSAERKDFRCYGSGAPDRSECAGSCGGYCGRGCSQTWE